MIVQYSLMNLAQPNLIMGLKFFGPQNGALFTVTQIDVRHHHLGAQNTLVRY